MTDKYGPMEGAGNSVGEAEWYDYAPTWAPSGVIGVPATTATSGDLAFASSGLNVSAGTGRANVRGAGFKRTGTPPTHAATANAHATWQRRDRLVLRRDLANNQTVTAVLQGTPAPSPVPPALTQVEAGVWEIPLFSFLVPPASGTSITGVVDERAWVDPSGAGPQSFQTSAARDAHIPSPTTGQVCTVAGVLQVYVGSWVSLVNNAGTSGVPIAGSAPPAGTPLLIKTIRQQLVTNGNGDAGVTFPGGAFPNGVLTAHVMTATEQPFFWVVHSLNNTLAAAAFRGYNITTGTVAGAQSVNAVVTVIGW